jgi:SAM-dependent methyltransferase
MLFSHLAKRARPGGGTTLGQWSSRRFYDGVLAVVREARAFRGRVLEVGPGEGVFAGQCRDAGLAYVAIEQNATLATQLKNDGFDVQVGTVPPLPFADEDVDLVAMMALVEHMPTFNDALDLLGECYRVLRPNGAVLIQVPDALRGGIDFPHWDYSHSFLPTAYRLRQLLDDAGFRTDKTVYFTGAFRGPIRLPLDLLGFLVHSRFVYWSGTSLGLEEWLLRYHKTFEPSVVMIARKPARQSVG